MCSTNSKSPRCIDGRKAILCVEWRDGRYVVAKRSGRAANEFGPQFLGAGLMFVRILQDVAKLSLVRAFEKTEEVFSLLGWTPQFHVDDHHGEYDFANMDEDEVIEVLMSEYLGGCGFALYAWGDDAAEVLRMAVARHWRIQVLTDEHRENGATLNHRASTTFKTPSRGGKTRFNLDYGDAKLVLILLDSLNDFGSGFFNKSLEWVEKNYGKVVVALGGVKTESEIVVID